MFKKSISQILIICLFILTIIFSNSILYALETEEALAEVKAEKEQKSAQLKEENKSNYNKYRITVLGNKNADQAYPGSGTLIDGDEFKAELGGTDDINRVLRKVPGVNIQEEDGYGLRPNIGFRGVSSERSAKITLMEDGVLIAPAPYSAPAAYFFPPVGRMEGIEVLKGASQIKYGPNTNGGSLNLLSSSIPEDFSAKVRSEFGSDNGRTNNVKIGASNKYFGGIVEAYTAESDGFKKLDGGGNTGFDIEDFSGKLRVNNDPASEVFHELTLKANTYSQNSNETYLGLTQEDFDNDPLRRYSASALDNMVVDHNLVSLQHYMRFQSGFDVTTTVYRHETDRNWYKIQSAGGENISNVVSRPSDFSNELDWIRGTDSPDDAIVLRNNNRAYQAQGIQTALGKSFSTGKLNHDLEVGFRYHEDEEDRFQSEDGYRMDNGTLVLTSTGAAGSNANRIGEAQAFATYIQDTIKYNKFTFTPGLRYENIDLRRTDYGTNDPTRSGADMVVTDTSVNVLIPGIGTHYAFTENFGTFAGVHKGFSPPGPSSNNQVREEESVNYELGAQYNKRSLNSELVFFFNDYENLLGADTLSSGNEGTGDFFNGGEAKTYGIEASVNFSLVSYEDYGFNLPVYANYTYTNAQFDSSFDSDLFGIVSNGDALPYIAENQGAIGIGFEKDKLGIYFDAHYVDSMPTIAGQANTLNTQATDSYFVTDARVEYKITDKIKWFANVNNIFDNEYVVARRPAGARPGAPRLFYSGIEIELG